MKQEKKFLVKQCLIYCSVVKKLQYEIWSSACDLHEDSSPTGCHDVRNDNYGRFEEAWRLHLLAQAVWTFTFYALLTGG